MVGCLQVPCEWLVTSSRFTLSHASMSAGTAAARLLPSRGQAAQKMGIIIVTQIMIPAHFTHLTVHYP